MLSQAFSGQLTARWRASHMQELLAEMNEQARALNIPMPRELEALP
jgi:type I restriction enzyme S subunit